MLYFSHKINVIFILNIRNESLINSRYKNTRIQYHNYCKLKNIFFYNLFDNIQQLKPENITILHEERKKNTFFSFHSHSSICFFHRPLIEAAATTASHLFPLTKQSVSIDSTIIHVVTDKTSVIHRSKDQTASLCTSV